MCGSMHAGRSHTHTKLGLEPAKKALKRYISRHGVLEGTGRAYAFFANIVRGVPQVFRRYFCMISNPHTLF